MSDDRIQRLTELARRVWPDSIVSVSTIKGDPAHDIVACIYLRVDGDVWLAVPGLSALSFDMLEAALLVGVGERSVPPAVELPLRAAITRLRLDLEDAGGLVDPCAVAAHLKAILGAERASFESACDTAEESDGRLERLAESWEKVGYTRCPSELRALLKERGCAAELRERGRRT